MPRLGTAVSLPRAEISFSIGSWLTSPSVVLIAETMAGLAGLAGITVLVAMTVTRGRRGLRDPPEGRLGRLDPLADPQGQQEMPVTQGQRGQREQQGQPGQRGQLGQLEQREQSGQLEQRGRLEQLGQRQAVFSACSLDSQLERATAAQPITRPRSPSRRQRGQDAFPSLRMVPAREQGCAWTPHPSLLPLGATA
jgi:hypothetical protein